MTSLSVKKSLSKNYQLYLMLLPPVLFILIFCYYPMYGAQIAFKKYNVMLGIWGSPWVGFAQFVRFFNSPGFFDILKNTIILSFYSLAVGFPFPIILALCLNYIPNPHFKKTVQMVTYLPNFISVVVVVGMLIMFFNTRIGPIGQLLTLITGQKIDIFIIPQAFRHLMVWSGVWQGAGFGAIIYLSALSSISPELHEAAITDGATILQRIWHIDIPGIMPTAIILLILSVGGILNTGFEKVLLLQKDVNLSYSEVIDTIAYKVGLASPVTDMAYSTAIGIFKSAVGFILLSGTNKIAQKLQSGSLW